MTAYREAERTAVGPAAPTRALADQWDLSAVARAVESTEGLLARCTSLARYRGSVTRLRAPEVAVALRELGALRNELTCLAAHATLRLACNGAGGEERRLAARADELLAEAEQQLGFFEIEWLQAPEEHAQSVLADDAIGADRYYLRHLRQLAAHTLTPREEELLANRDPAAQDAWCDLYDLTIGSLKIDGPDGPIDVAGAHAQLASHDPARRARIIEALDEAIEPQLHTLAHCLDTLIADRLRVNRLRGHQHPRGARDVDNDIPPQVIDQLLDSVARGNHVAQRWFSEKARKLNRRSTMIADERAPLPGSPILPFEDALSVIARGLGRLSPKLSEFVRLLAENGSIDARPRPGKADNAFCLHPAQGLLPLVLVNHYDSVNDTVMLAHELGHAIHYLLAAEAQTAFTYDPPALVSELPAIVAELAALEQLAEDAGTAAVRSAVEAHRNDRMCDCIFRQAAIARFEQAAYEARADGTLLEAEVLDELWLEEMRAAYEPAITVPSAYAHAWAYVPHLFHRPFYNHTYVFGALVSVLIHTRRTKLGGEFGERYLTLLRYGGSTDPTSQLQACDIDLADASTWDQALEELSRWLDRRV
jgi:oligoendopeptidase F